MKQIIAYLFFVSALSTAYSQKNNSFNTNDYIRALKYSTDVMINDVTSPVAAARYYAYICLTANETYRLFEKQQPYFSGSLKGLNGIAVNQTLVDSSDKSFAVILALYKAGTRLLPSGYILKNKTDSLYLVAKKKKIDDAKIKATSNLVDSVLLQVMKYVAADGFFQT